ncbi:MAG: archaetidylserine decarboxylase [Pigmentiphaga sp.]|nr:archaetidylserine decarboxylase [Pigmentiphaga sp.]
MSLKDRLFLLSQYLTPHYALSRLMGRLADCTWERGKNFAIERFIARYRVDMTQAIQSDPRSYPSFNAFFTRALKPGLRPFNPQAQVIISPVDGAISQLGKINSGRIFQAKGHHFDATELLGGDANKAHPFQDGSFATIYLSPRDYHRIHMPCDAKLKETYYIPGKLFSVNPLTASNVPRLFSRNERLVCLFETAAGPMALVLVGAMIVGAMETVWGGAVAPHGKQVVHQVFQEPIAFEKGEEMGRFKLGSTVVLLFGKHAVSWDPGLHAGSALSMGQSLALSSSRL